MARKITTTDLNDFGTREKRLAEELLKAWREQGLPVDFYGKGIVIMMNSNSGRVFLTNSDYQVAMMNNKNLEMFYTCPICGHEGFLKDMGHAGDKECRVYLKDIGYCFGCDIGIGADGKGLIIHKRGK